MTPEQAVIVVDNLIEFKFIFQTLLYMQFVLLGGLVALCFMSFLKKVV